MLELLQQLDPMIAFGLLCAALCAIAFVAGAPLGGGGVVGKLRGVVARRGESRA